MSAARPAGERRPVGRQATVDPDARAIADPGPADPYDRIAELAREELALAEAGELDALVDLHARRAALIATLPTRPPAHCRASLERAAAAQQRTTALLAAAHAELAGELGHLARGRRAARSYAPADAPATPVLDRPA